MRKDRAICSSGWEGCKKRMKMSDVLETMADILHQVRQVVEALPTFLDEEPTSRHSIAGYGASLGMLARRLASVNEGALYIRQALSYLWHDEPYVHDWQLVGCFTDEVRVGIGFQPFWFLC